jgi:hypothetical protein
MNNLIKKFITVNKLINLNKKLFKYSKNYNRGLILVEYFSYYPSMITFSLFSFILSNKYNSKIVSYNPRPLNYKKNILSKLKRMSPFSSWSIFKSFGVKNLFSPKINKKKYSQNYSNLISIIKSKQDLLDLKIENILVGDLFYDEYLATRSKSTIDISSKNFQDFFLEAVSLFYFWYEYVSKNKINAVVLSHSVYFVGLLGRISITKDIPVYQVSGKYAYYLNKNNFIKMSGFSDGKQEFDKLSDNIKLKLKKISKDQLEKRFIGLSDVKQSNDQKTNIKIFGDIDKSKKILHDTKNETKILIASHCFQDAVHAYGKNLFVDFYEWIDFLGKKSEQLTDFDWYFKIHPAIYERNILYAKYFANKYPRINILPKETTNNQLIYEGISVVLTTYGSVGHEFPMFNIPVVNACVNGPHIDYKINIYPKNVDDYSKYINKLNKLKIEDNLLIKDKIYEYYSMRYLMDYSPFKKIIELTQKYSQHFNTIDVINYWLSTFDHNEFKSTVENYKQFINSKKFRMTANNLEDYSRPLNE